MSNVEFEGVRRRTKAESNDDTLERLRSVIADLRARFEKAEKDAERLDWLEAQHTLHGAVEVLYVIYGYEVQVTHDGNPIGPAFQADTLRDAIDAAIVKERTS